MINKVAYLEKAIKITEAWSRGGSAGSPAGHLGEIYKKLLELAEDAEK